METPLLIDSHAHLDDKRFTEDLDAVVARAKEAGLKSIITVGCWSKRNGFGPVLGVLGKHDFLYLSLGVHPHEAKDAAGAGPWDEIKSIALKRGADGRSPLVAIGETGLDYYYDHSPRDVQKEVFKRQISLARELNLPLIIHSRDAEADTIEIMRGEGAGKPGRGIPLLLRHKGDGKGSDRDGLSPVLHGCCHLWQGRGPEGCRKERPHREDARRDRMPVSRAGALQGKEERACLRCRDGGGAGGAKG